MTASAGATTDARQPSTTRFIGPFTGVATGGRVETSTHDNKDADPNHHVTSTSDEEYKGRFLFSFRIDNGVVTGTGEGTYQTATWHLAGTNGSNGAFSCDVPLTTTDYGVKITGTATNGDIRVLFTLDGAKEHNADYDCGAKFTGFATDSTFLDESLQTVEDAAGSYVAVNQAHPAPRHLSFHSDTGDDKSHKVIDDNWDFTFTGPSGGNGGGGGGVPDTGRPGEDPGPGGCTIKGTAHADVLRGTAKSDVICGYGGNDVILARGGNDVVYGGAGKDKITGGAGKDSLHAGAGNDTLLARDGTVDLVDGGPGHDAAATDAKDLRKSVEAVP